jgi:predicted metalloprotease with PDZ domain
MTTRLRSSAAVLIALAASRADAAEPLRYSVDLGDRTGHVFAVTLDVDSLSPKNDVFQFASTAPGTYQVMDIGRYVRSFEALDRKGQPIATDHISTNQWRIAEPRRVRTIRYSVVATRDTVVAEHVVYPMCGSTLQDDHAQINGQAVFGFPRGMQATPISVALVYPPEWKVGTALKFVAGRYHADSYDQLVDSPILLGRLTTARIDVTGVPVEIFVFSKTDQITAPQLAAAMSSMLYAAGGFLGKLPVDRYAFLYDFGPASAGAWEHSYSSEYVLNEVPYSPAVGARVTDIAAHEFFHVVTPLNIHSEIIEHFNFETPVPSQHLWLYEGTTEWAAHKMQLESGLKMPDAYLATLVGKIRSDRLQFDTTYSLSKLAKTSFSDSGQVQYGNIYQRGAIVAGLLDIKLLEVSGGKHGLRDLITDLSKSYGKKRAFAEDSLFDVIVRKTSPAVRDFVTRYIQGSDHPPVKEYYAKLGITLVEDANGLPVKFEVDPNPTLEQLRLRAAWLGRPAVVP